MSIEANKLACSVTSNPETQNSGWILMRLLRSDMILADMDTKDGRDSYRGDWSSDTSYQKDDLVTFNDNLYAMTSVPITPLHKRTFP